MSTEWAFLVTEPLYEWRAKALHPVNPSAERYGPFDTKTWDGLAAACEVLAQGIDGPVGFRVTSATEGARVLEGLSVGNQAFLKVTGAGVSRDYLILRDNLLSMLDRELSAPLKTMSDTAQALKTSAIDDPELIKLVNAWMAPATKLTALMPATLGLAKLYGHESLDAEERILFADLLPALVESVRTPELEKRGVKVELSVSEKALGAMYGPSYWVEMALRGLLRDVVEHAAENTDVRIVARQMPYMLNLVFRVVGGIGQRGVDLSVLDERPLIPSDGKVTLDRVRLNLAYAVLRRIGGNFKFKSSGLGVEYIVEIPTGQGMNACAETRAKTASEQAEQYARDMAMLMEAVSRRKS